VSEKNLAAMKINFRFTIATILVMLAVGAVRALAAAPTGITISPAFQQVNILASETQHPLQFSITNNQSTAQNLSLSTADFGELSDTGGLFFVGTNPTQQQAKYGLAKWFSLDQSSLILAAHQTQVIRAEILNRTDLAGGGHYGALLINLGKDKVVPNKITVRPIASSLLFVNKVGGDTHSLKLLDAKASHSLFRLPSSVSLKFQNTGNTHVVPRGLVTITNPSGQLVSKGIVNQDSNIQLPQTSRIFDVTMQSISHSSSAGHYKLTVNYRFDGYANFRTYQTNFLLVPVTDLAALIILVVALVIGGRYFRRRLKAKTGQK
jgi:hypothetical protein